MKKILFLFVTVGLLFSCGTSKTVIQSKKVIKGYWTMETVTFSEAGKFNATLLNDVSKECFEGSSWRFISNNNTGTYTINNGDCGSGDRYFIFTIKEIDQATGLYDFMLKPTDAKGKSETNAGFRLRLSQLSDQNMQWQQTVSLDGSPVTINMNFTKTTE